MKAERNISLKIKIADDKAKLLKQALDKVIAAQKAAGFNSNILNAEELENIKELTKIL